MEEFDRWLIANDIKKNFLDAARFTLYHDKNRIRDNEVIDVYNIINVAIAWGLSNEFIRDTSYVKWSSVHFKARELFGTIDGKTLLKYIYTDISSKTGKYITFASKQREILKDFK